MRALVAGGAGFIGSTLVDRLLAEGHGVDVVDDLSTGRLSNLVDARADRTAELHIHQVDVREPEVVDLVERRAPEVLFQLAALERPDAAQDVTATVVGTLRLLEGARRCGARKVVVLADAQLYGESAELPLKESDAGEPSTPHGVAQLAVVEYLRLYRERHGVDFTVLVADAVYGPRQAEGVVVAAGRAALAGAAPARVGGAADLLFVDDAVDALVRGAERAGGLLLNLGWGVERSWGDVVDVVAEAAGRVDGAVGDAGGTERRTALDGGRARIHLGWEPWTPMEEGVARVLRWLHATAT